MPSNIAVIAARRRRRGVRSPVALLHTFTGADSATTVPSADTGQPTIVISGTFGISSNQLYNPLAGSGIRIAWDAGASDGTATMTVATLGGEPALLAHYVDTSNFVELMLSAPNLFLRKVVAGGFTTVTSFAQAVSAGDTLGLRFSGTTVDILLNGVAISSGNTIAEHTTATKFGVSWITGSSVTRIDNLRMDRP